MEEKGRPHMFKKTLNSLALATSLAAGAVACKQPAPQVIVTNPAATDISRPGQMMVTGTATLEVSPDCADLTMTISADGPRPGLATSAVKAKEQAMLAALTKLGIETSDIKLSFLTLNPIYANNPDGWSTLKVATYRSEVTVTITTRHFDLIGDITEAGANAGATSMSSQFRRSDLPELKKKIREMALTAAKDKAAQTAKTLGIDLGRVVSVIEAPAGGMWSSPYFPQVANVALERGAPTPPISIGGALQPLTLEITIGYELAKTV